MKWARHFRQWSITPEHKHIILQAKATVRNKHKKEKLAR
jgi:hypothetical protein